MYLAYRLNLLKKVRSQIQFFWRNILATTDGTEMASQPTWRAICVPRQVDPIHERCILHGLTKFRQNTLQMYLAYIQWIQGNKFVVRISSTGTIYLKEGRYGNI